MVVVCAGGILAAPQIVVGQNVVAVSAVSAGGEEDTNSNCGNDNHGGYYEYQELFHIIVCVVYGSVIHVFTVPFGIVMIIVMAIASVYRFRRDP